MGEVNRCAEAILIRSANAQPDAQKSGDLPSISDLPEVHRNHGSPEVTCTSTFLRHSEHAIRIVVPAAACTSTRATADLTNCIVEDNKIAFAMSYASQVAQVLGSFSRTI